MFHYKLMEIKPKLFNNNLNMLYNNNNNHNKLLFNKLHNKLLGNQLIIISENKNLNTQD
jgi:hypothetical protein